MNPFSFETLILILSTLIPLACPSAALAFGSGPQQEPAPQLETLRMPAHPSLLPTGPAWSTSGRELPAYAVVKERRLGNQHWVEFQPDPRAEQDIHLVPDRMRIARKANGSPDVVITRDGWTHDYQITIAMDLGLFGRDREEIERLSIERGAPVRMAEFSRAAWSWEERIQFLESVRADFLSASLVRRGTDQIRTDRWTADFIVTVSFSMDRDQFSELRKRLNRRKESIDLELDYRLGLIRALEGGGAQPSGPEGKLATITEWVEHRARGAIACIHIARKGEVKAKTSGECAHYWD